MSIKPLSNRILIEVIENSDMSDGGIFIGQATTTFVNGKEKTVQKTVGKVKAVGPGKYDDEGFRRPPECEIGDIVCFSDTCGREVDDEHVMIREDDIMFFMDEARTIEIGYS